MADTPVVPEIKMTNRRRMAWASLATGIFTSVAIIACAMFIPSVADRLSKIDLIIITFLSFLGAPILVYMGGAAVMNWKAGK